MYNSMNCTASSKKVILLSFCKKIVYQVWYEEVPLMDLSSKMQEFKPLTSAKSLSTAYEIKCQAASQHELWESTFDLLSHYLYKLQGNKTWWPFQAFFLDLYRQGCSFLWQVTQSKRVVFDFSWVSEGYFSSQNRDLGPHESFLRQSLNRSKELCTWVWKS